ncbi:MAG TPA: hypothetical protein VK841_09390 [Polyangiaceae bacterium]|jgi:hypothetical protein|nr:hypothetical protein [Polyangiaceae bacterium]
MPSKPKSLRVFINPYSSVDHNGNPSGSLLADPVGHIKYRDARQGDTSLEPSERFDQRSYVGARVVRGAMIRDAQLLPLARGGQILIGAEHEHSWDFDKEVQTVPYTLYYHRAILDGHVFAADAKTWKALSKDRRTFVEPKQLLAWAKEGAIAAHLAMHGELDRDPEDEDTDHEDERLQRLATHWDDHVEQTHPMGAKAAAHFHAARAAELAEAVKADKGKPVTVDEVGRAAKLVADANAAAERAKRAHDIHVAHLERAAKYHADRAAEFATARHPLEKEAIALAEAAAKALDDAKQVADSKAPAVPSAPPALTTTEH